MRKCAHLVFLFSWLAFPTAVSAQNVFYGERVPDDSKLALFFDKDGFPYPDYAISDSSMTRAYGSLFTWFMQHNEAFIELSAQHELFPERIDKEAIFRLRDSITAGNIRRINERSSDFPAVAFYVHGFRKQFIARQSGVTSVEEFRLLEANLKTYGKPQALEIEVYWDGTYDCCFSMNHKRNKALFELYETAAGYARAVGLGLRPVIAGVKSDQIQVISHSLGARVVTSALFGQEVEASAVPAQKTVSICLLAPAIDGHETFLSWNERGVSFQPGEKDNYRLLIVYNENDFVLRKKDPKTGLFGPGTHRYGETSLGCNYRKEAVKLKAYFEKHYPGSEMVLVDKSALGKAHSFRVYSEGSNLEEVSDFLWKGGN